MSRSAGLASSWISPDGRMARRTAAASPAKEAMRRRDRSEQRGRRMRGDSLADAFHRFGEARQRQKLQRRQGLRGDAERGEHASAGRRPRRLTASRPHPGTPSLPSSDRAAGCTSVGVDRGLERQGALPPERRQRLRAPAPHESDRTREPGRTADCIGSAPEVGAIRHYDTREQAQRLRDQKAQKATTKPKAILARPPSL